MQKSKRRLGEIINACASFDCRNYAASDSFQDLCCDVVDAYVDTLKDGPQLVDSGTPLLQIIFKIITVSVYGTR